MALQLKTYNLLPIALSVGLPGLGFISRQSILFGSRHGVVVSWIIASFILYLLWHLIWKLWENQSRVQKWTRIGLLALFNAFVLCLFYRSIILSNHEFHWHYFLRYLLAGGLFAIIQYVLKAQENIARLQLEKEQLLTENYRVQLKALRKQN